VRHAASRRLRPGLRAVFLAISLAVLLVPFATLLVLQVWERVLVRRTEAQLVAQGALVAAAFAEALEPELLARGRVPAEHGRRAPPAGGAELRPVPPRLDLGRHAILPRPDEPGPPPHPADPAALAAGARLTPVLVESQRTTLAGVRIVDAGGIVVASSRGEIGLSLAAREEVRRALDGENVSVLRERLRDGAVAPLDSISRDNDVRVFVGFPVQRHGRTWGAVVLSRTPQGLAQSLYEVRGVVAAVLTATVLVAALIGLVTSSLVIRPVRELVQRTRRVAAGARESARPLEHPGTREVAELSEAFADMAEALQARTDAVQAFASHVSHELKTPLAALRGAVELLLDHGESMTTDERSRFHHQVADDGERMERLLSRLLELARADVVRASGLTADAASGLRRVAEGARRDAGGTEIEIDVEPDLPQVAVAPEVLDTLVGHLVENAVRHARSRVRLGARTVGDGTLVLSATDDGPGVSEANAPRVFEPFFTTARATGGTGLGLAIVRALARAHGGDVRLAERSAGTRFEVTLPVAPPTRARAASWPPAPAAP
jgi:signal transduction histidine kinase